MAFDLFAVTAPGLNLFAAQELRALDFRPAGKNPGKETGGSAFQSDLAGLYRANLQLRTVTRVLMRLGQFYATGFAELRRKAGHLPWEACLKPGRPVALRVTCRKSRLYHSDAVAERVLGAIGDRLGQAPPAADFDEEGIDQAQLVVVRLFRDRCTISMDSSGEALHRRGYRLATAKAPLRETLAAGILLAAGWDGTQPLIDPFCGSGTIPIEAALLAGGLAPGRARRFAFMDWPNFDPRVWEQVLTKAGPAKENTRPLLGSDRDEGAVGMATENARRAGVEERIRFLHQAVSAIEPPLGNPGWILTNPPYGLRVSAGYDLRNLYAQFGNTLRAKFTGWQVGVLCNDDRLLSQTGLQFDRGYSLNNGGVPVKLALGKID